MWRVEEHSGRYMILSLVRATTENTPAPVAVVACALGALYDDTMAERQKDDRARAGLLSRPLACDFGTSSRRYPVASGGVPRAADPRSP